MRAKKDKEKINYFLTKFNLNNQTKETKNNNIDKRNKSALTTIKE